MDDHFRMMMLHQAEMERKRGPHAEVGDLAYFYGRVVEVTGVEKLGEHNRARTVELTDAGGIKHHYELPLNAWADEWNHFRVISRPKDQVLDVIAQVTGGRTNDAYFQLILRAERWLADPRPGDLFAYNNSFDLWALVDDVQEKVTVRQSDGFDINTGWRWTTRVYDSAADFRAAWVHSDRPGYKLLAFSSRRTGELPIIPVVS